MASVSKKQVQTILKLLKKHYPQAQCSLHYRNCYELLVATVLSAQCTDQRVNTVTPAFFRLYPSALELSNAKEKEVEDLIRSTGFFRNKTKHLLSIAKQLVAHHRAQVPTSMQSLCQLPGVGRKTANVVLGNGFHKAEGIVVDTHVGRIVQRWGWVLDKNPVLIEKQLMMLLPSREWVVFSHRLIAHGRALCRARSPKCDQCFLKKSCPRKGDLA